MEKLTPEQITENFNKFRSLCEKMGNRTLQVLTMVDDLGERLALCPASAKKDFHGAFPGGLCDHSLRVLSNLIKLNKTFEWNLPKDSMIISALMHDIGKIGMPGSDAKNDFYVPQTDSWRIEKLGEEYKYNEELPYMSTPDRSMYVLQHYGIKLNVDETLAIKLNDGFLPLENKIYCLKVSQLVIGVQTADMIATMDEKNVWYW